MKNSGIQRALRFSAIVYLAVLLVLWGFIYFDTGKLWPVTLFLFSPRWIVAFPLWVLVPLTLAFRTRLTYAYVLHGLIIVFPVMGYRMAWSRPDQLDAGRAMTVMTYNLGEGHIDTDELVGLTIRHGIDVLVLQECPASLSKPVFEKLGWAHRQESNIAIGSPSDLGEMQILDRPAGQPWGIAAVCCELRFPAAAPLAYTVNKDPLGPATVRIVAVHFPTFRPALEKARRFETTAGAAIDDLGVQYRAHVASVREQVRSFRVPTVIAGDFNIPVESAYYRDYWSGFQNALSSVGTGLRHTKHTRFHGVRIDHVLADGNWEIGSAVVGPGLGGDHRPVIVNLSLCE